MNTEQQEKFQLEYQLGKQAFERGKYRLSVQHLQNACQFVPLSSQRGGEVQMWLVTAYQATGMLAESIALCKQLCLHPFLETRKEAKRLLYIIEAPELTRPKEWMVEIPDLTQSSISEPEYYRASGEVTAKKSVKKSKLVPEEPIDLSQVNTQDNQFIWVALGATFLIIGGLIWLS